MVGGRGGDVWKRLVSLCALDLVNTQLRVARKHLEVDVVMQNRHSGTYGSSGDETVSQLADGLPLPSATAIERGSVVIVRRPSSYHRCPRQQPTKAQKMRLIPRPGEHFHSYHIADGNLTRQHLVNEITDRGACIPQELYPSGGIDQNHVERLERIASRSPSQPIPRSARASSTDTASAARVRNAKLTASRLVVSR